jgi:hypothetical protein
MKCALCNGNLIRRTGSVEFKTRSLGTINVPNLQFLECDACDEKLLDRIESKKATDYIRNKEQQRINNLPIGEFLSAKEAATFFEITKQAFSKHPKIKGGLIYSCKIDNRKFYHKKSLEQFRETGNGKFQLPIPIGSRMPSRAFIPTIVSSGEGYGPSEFSFDKPNISPDNQRDPQQAASM